MIATAVAEPGERRVVLEDVSWELYEHLLGEVGAGVRLTYDEGRLEIMSPLPIHEKVKKIVSRLIEAYAEEMDVLIEGFGLTTYRRKELRKGLEPDECYYVQNAAKVIGKEKFDWKVDPVPDLAIEVGISRPEVARQPIYAALGVPEIWNYDGNELLVLLRKKKGRASKDVEYVEAEKSLAFPDLPMAEVNRLLQVGLTQGQSAAVKGMREWCRNQG